MKKRTTTSARRRASADGPRWDVIRADAKSFVTRLPGLFRGDFTAMMLVFANVYPIIDMLFRGDPVGSILVIYWIQMMIIGFWTVVKLGFISRWLAIVQAPVFLVMYLSIVNIFGIMAGGMLDDQMRGTEWHDQFSLMNYFVPALLFFLAHAFSFRFNFVGGEEYKSITWEEQIGKAFLRVMPMWMAATVGGFIGGFLNAPAVVVAFVLPVKMALDIFGHFVSHGKMRLDEDPEVPLIS